MAASARTEDADPGPGRVDAGPTRLRPLPQGGRAGAAPFAPSHRPGQLLGGAPPAVADPAGSCVRACGELPSTAFRGSAVFPTLSPARRPRLAAHAAAFSGDRRRHARVPSSARASAAAVMGCGGAWDAAKWRFYRPLKGAQNGIF